jgi:hypothetical protein
MTAISLAALITAGKVSPSSPTRYARSIAGNAWRSTGSNDSRASASGTASIPVGSRSGQPSASWIGSFMSGLANCAIIEPSRNSAMAWTMPSGCTTTWICG